MFTYIGFCLLLIAVGVFLDIRTGSGWDIPSSLRLPIAFAFAAAGILLIWSDLQGLWRGKNQNHASDTGQSVIRRFARTTILIVGIIVAGTIIVLRVYEIAT